MIQSFAPDEVTPEQAMQIGEELCDRYLKGDYQYVIAVHTDKEHTHCHVIFNNTNLYNGLSFTTEHNQGRKNERAWAELREISDEICKEHGLSLIDPIGKGVSYLELMKQKEGKSWKDKLRNLLREIISYSKSFDDFLKNCTASGIEYVYTPQNKVKLKFRLSGDGQQRFTRADTLGADYTAERITEQIAEIQEKLSAANVTPEMLIEPPKQIAVPKTEPKPIQTPTAPTKPIAVPKTEPKPTPTRTTPPKPSITPTPPTTPKNDYVYKPPTDEEFFKAFGVHLDDTGKPTAPTPKPTESKTPEKKEDVWESIRGMRDSDKMIADLESGGITSFYDFTGFMHNMPHDDDHTDELSALDKKIKGVDKLIKMMKQCSQHSATYNEYQGRSTFTQKHFRKKNAAAIDAYEEADKYITEHIKAYYIKGKPPKQSDLEQRLIELKSKYNALVPEHNAFITRRDTALKYTRQVRKYLNEQHMKREREKSKQRTQAKHKNSYLE